MEQTTRFIGMDVYTRVIKQLSSRSPPPVTLGKPRHMAHFSPIPPPRWRSWSGVYVRPATER